MPKVSRSRRIPVGASSGQLVDRTPLEEPPWHIRTAATMRAVMEMVARPGFDELWESNEEVRLLCDAIGEASDRIIEIVRFVLAGENKGKYGLTPDAFWDIVWDQDLGCAICGTEFCPGGPKMFVDHNHATGEVRGVLCPTCNSALGLFGDSPDRLHAALEYLEDRGCYGADALAEVDR